MKKVWPWIIGLVGGIWAVTNFVAANSPKDVQEKAGAWTSLPVIRDLPDWLTSLASNSIMLALTFTIVGAVAGWMARRRWVERTTASPLQRLGYEASLTAYGLDNMSSVFANPVVVSRLNVTMNKLRRAGFDVPRIVDGNLDKGRASFYLHQIAAYMTEDEEVAAKNAARSLVAQWNAERPRSDGLPS